MSRVVTPRDLHFWGLVKTWRTLGRSRSPLKKREREHLFARMHHLQHRNLQHYAYKFRSPRVPMLEEDAMQAALIGFLRALEKWDPQKGAWITCLFMWCRREVQDAQADEPVVYRPQAVGKPYKVFRAEEAFYAREGRDATAQELGTTDAQFEKWRGQEVFVRESFDRPAKEENEQGAHSDGRTSMYRAAPSAYTPEMPKNAEELLELDEYERALRSLTKAEIEILLGSDGYEKEDLQELFK